MVLSFTAAKQTFQGPKSCRGHAEGLYKFAQKLFSVKRNHCSYVNWNWNDVQNFRSTECFL